MGLFDRFWGQVKPPAVARVPAAVPQEQSDASDLSPTERRNRPRVNAQAGVKVLIIDDSATVVAVLRKFLRSAGYTTFDAPDAEQGLELVARELPDLVFLDIVLPAMNGFGALRVIRKDPLTQHIPVIMISGNENATEQFYVNRIGADDFMKKPFSRTEVFARIENLLDANRMPRRKAQLDAKPAHNEVTSSFAATPVPAQRPAQVPPVRSALEARKELTAMGLQYFDTAQFFAAIRREDQLAVGLFVVGGGVARDEPFNGTTAIALANGLGVQPIIELISQARSKN
jgi:DNA-binding response OmpR family regulator